MNRKHYVIGAVVVALVLIAFPFVVPAYNNYVHSIREVDNRTDYATLKSVEDTCRAMISTYNADLMTYETYKDSPDESLVGVALQAKIRANSTAIQYNQFVLKNNYVWKDNVPEDISAQLALVE